LILIFFSFWFSDGITIVMDEPFPPENFGGGGADLAFEKGQKGAVSGEFQARILKRRQLTFIGSDWRATIHRRTCIGQ
jgi:hypothetical protein